MNVVDEKTIATRIRFGVFEVDLEACELYRSGLRVRLQSQPFRLLAALIEHAGELVSRETLQRELWGDDTTVDFDHSLGIAVNKLRDALGDAAENPRFIETLAKRGYRFIAPVQRPAVPVVPPGPVAARPVLLGGWVALPLALIALALMAWLWIFAPLPAPYQITQVTFSGHVLANDPEIESFSSSVSDGARIYFSHLEDGNPVLAVALSANGEISRFPLPSEVAAPLIGALSPDGSRLIVRSHLLADPEQPLWIVPTLGGDARRIPNVQAHDAAWMPDGRHLLVAHGNELTVLLPDGGDARHFLSTPGLAFWLRWSPDGHRLRFTLRDPVRQTSALWEADADGARPHPLLAAWSQPATECCGNWTSDGKFFVFQSSHSGHSEIWARRERPWFLAGRAPWQITSGPLEYQAPSTRPGSHRVDFIGASSQYELLRATPGLKAFLPLEPNLSAALLAEFSPDGQWVVWLNAADNSLWRSRVDGSDRIELTTPPMHVFTMKWSPDHQSLAIMAAEPGKPWKIYRMDADGGKPQPILDEARNEADPSWSPDGQSILFGRPPDRMDGARPKAIYLLHLQSHKVEEIPGSDGLFSPRLSPDGRFIAALPLDQRSLMLYDLGRRRWTTLARHGAGDPIWSHDSQFIYFQDFLEQGRPVYRMRVADQKLERVATIESLLPITATDYRLIGLAPGDLPLVTARTPAVNLYETSLLP